MSLSVCWVPVPEEAPAAALEHHLPLLDPEERQVYDRYRVDFKKVEFLTGRVLLKTQLAERLHLSPDQIRFVKNDYGKLYLHPDQDPGGLFFNLSHTAGMIACVVGGLERAGIDVERTDKDAFEVMPKVFRPDEIAWVEAQTSAASRSRAFFLLWTRKEAVMKAEGLGFSLPPLSFGVPTAFERDADDSYHYLSWQWMPSMLCSLAVAKQEGAAPPVPRVQRIDYQALCHMQVL